MKKSQIKDFFKTINSSTKTQLSISEEFVEWAMSIFSISELQAFELFDSNEKKIILEFELEIKRHKSRYTFPKYEFSPVDPDLLVKPYFLEEPELRQQIELKLEKWEELESLIKNLEWREFEQLAKYILEKNNLTNITITQAVHDQGIDFYGYFDLSQTGTKLNRLYNDAKFRVIGQVKHSKSANGVSHQKISSFGTEIGKLRKLNNSNYFQSLDEDFLTCPYPIIGIFIANSYYPTKAIDFANEYGIIFWDGIQISQDLATEDFIDQITDGEVLSEGKLKSLLK